MRVSSEIIGIQEWINDTSIVEASRINRQRMINQFEKANRASIQQIISDIKTDKISVYSACKRFVDGLRANHASTTVYVYRSMLPGMFQSVLGEENFRASVFDRLVPNAPSYVTMIKQIPTLDQIRTMLKIAAPMYRAIIAGLAVGGFRISEWITRKMGDLEIRPEGYARVKLQAFETKARYLRYVFLTKEVVEFVKIHQLNFPSEYVFKGYPKGHLQYNSAREQIKTLFRKAGMNDSQDKTEIFTSHSFRTFAGDEMRACGMTEKAVLSIIGHRNALGAESHYTDWNRIEKEWFENCGKRITFLENSEQVKTLEKKNSVLETLLSLTEEQRQKLFSLLK